MRGKMEINILDELPGMYYIQVDSTRLLILPIVILS